MNPVVIMAIDPGRWKCGLAIVDQDARVFKKIIIAAEELTLKVTQLLSEYPVSLFVLGDRTTSKQVFCKLQTFGLQIEMIDEDRSSMEGRYRYLKENTKGFRCLVPIGLRVPDKPFDDYVAVVLAERFLEKIKLSEVNNR